MKDTQWQEKIHELILKGIIEPSEQIVTRNDTVDVDKIAKFLIPALESTNDPIAKMAMIAGAQDATAMLDSGAASEDPAEAEAATLPGADGPLNLEQVSELVAMMVHCGKILPEEAKMIRDALALYSTSEAGGGLESPPLSRLREQRPKSKPRKQLARICDPLKEAAAILKQIDRK